MMAGDFIWYELITPDPAGSKAFYDAVVGWDIDDHNTMESGGSDYRMINRAGGGFAGGVLKLDDKMKAGGARPTWLGYVQVDDVDAAAKATEAAGGAIHLPPFDIPNVGRIAMIADPQGNPLYLMDPIPPEGQPDAKSDVFSVDAEQRIGWNELATRDAEALRPFYEQLFGWDTEQFMDMGEYGKYRFVFNDGVRIGAMSGTMPDAPQAWRYYIRVPSIATAVEAVNAGGGKVTMGPHEVPGGDHIIIGTDPQGAEFALVGKA
jgi:predicted enzyme related to lactoylglutathione lyase